MSNTILIVDDDPIERQILQMICADHLNHKTILAENGTEALSILAGKDAGDIDLLLLDLMMPEIGGLQVLKEIRPLRPDIGIIVVTAYEDLDAVISTRRAGADDFILKNEGPARIMMAIANTLERYKLSNEVLRLVARPGTHFSPSNGSVHPSAVRRLVDVEADAIRGALASCDWKISEVARQLGIGRSTLYRKMDELNIKNPKHHGYTMPESGHLARA